MYQEQQPHSQKLIQAADRANSHSVLHTHMHTHSNAVTERAECLEEVFHPSLRK